MCVCVHSEVPRSRILMRPPTLFNGSPPIEGCFQGLGGVYNLAPDYSAFMTYL